MADQLGEAEQTATSLNVQFQALKLENAPYDQALASGRVAAYKQVSSA